MDKVFSNGQADCRLVVGVTGAIGAGVSTVSKALSDKGGFHQRRLSHAIRERLLAEESAARAKKTGNKTPLLEQIEVEQIPKWRWRLQDTGDLGRKDDLAYWAKTALKDLPDDTKLLVIDGIRNTGEVRWLRQRFPTFFLVAVHAEYNTRWERVKNGYEGNQRLFEEADQRDLETEDDPGGQQVGKCVSAADYVLVNEKDLGAEESQKDNLYESLAPVLALMQGVHEETKVTLRPATEEEVHMATAYAQSHMSRCLKRQVGAVIVNDRNIPLSIGYNENPIGVHSCAAPPRFCFKDERINKTLEGLGKITCPKCGEKQESLKQPWKCLNQECRANFKKLFAPGRGVELCTAIHAEERAIRSLGGQSVEGGKLYCTTFPCFQCARYILDAGIKFVVYVEAYPILESKEFLTDNGVEVSPFEGFKARAFNTVFRRVD